VQLARRSHSRRAIVPTAASPRCLCHGLTCLAVAGGRLLHPGDAQVEPLEAIRISALLLLHASGYPSARIDRRGSAIRVIGREERSPALRAARHSFATAPIVSARDSFKGEQRWEGSTTASARRNRPPPLLQPWHCSSAVRSGRENKAIAPGWVAHAWIWTEALTRRRGRLTTASMMRRASRAFAHGRAEDV